MPMPRGSCKNALQRLVGITRKIKRKGRTRNRIYCDLVVKQIFFRRHFVIFGNRIDAVGREDAVILKVRRTVLVLNYRIHDKNLLFIVGFK